MKNFSSRPVACNRDCGATCALLAVGDEQSGVSLRRNPLNHPWKVPCLRGLRAVESRNSPERLTAPLMREGERGAGGFREVSWETALSAVRAGLERVMDTSGAPSILDFGGSGACKGALHHAGRLTSRFLSQLGAVTRLKGSYSFQASSFVIPFAYGSADTGYDTRTLKDTRLVLLWGANTADTRFGNESDALLRHIRACGGQVIVIDPRRTRTAALYGTEWIPIRPGTDTAVMAAMAWVIDSGNLTDREFIHTYVNGAGDFFRYLRGETDGTAKTPEWAETISGVPAETIRRLALLYAAARPAALVPGFSIQRTLGGEDAFRMAIALQAITGNAGRSGGTPGTNMWVGPRRPRIPALASPPGAAGGTVPKAVWPRAILSGRAGGFPADFKAAYMAGSNYLNQGSDIAAGIRALRSLEFIVSHEIFLTPTARFADIVLPATHYLEREDVIVPEDNYLYYSAKIFDPAGGSRDDFDIFDELTGRLGLDGRPGPDGGFSGGRTKSEWVNHLIDRSDITAGGREAFKTSGIYDGGDHERQGLGDFIGNPRLHPLDTPSGKIELSPESYAQTGFTPWPEYRPVRGEENHPLQMVTPHSRFRINSTGSIIPWVRELDPAVLEMNPADAAARGIADGRTVRVYSSKGEMRVPVRITGDIMSGVVSCVQGSWYTGGIDGKADTADGSVNRLTSLDPTLPSIGTRTHSVFVEVRGEAG